MPARSARGAVRERQEQAKCSGKSWNRVHVIHAAHAVRASTTRLRVPMRWSHPRAGARKAPSRRASAISIFEPPSSKQRGSCSRPVRADEPRSLSSINTSRALTQCYSGSTRHTYTCCHCIAEGSARVHTNTTSSSKHLSASSRHGAQRGHAARTCNSACSAQARARGMQVQSRTTSPLSGSKLVSVRSPGLCSTIA